MPSLNLEAKSKNLKQRPKNWPKIGQNKTKNAFETESRGFWVH